MYLLLSRPRGKSKKECKSIMNGGSNEQDLNEG